MRCANTIKEGPFAVEIPKINSNSPLKFLVQVTRTKELNNTGAAIDNKIIADFLILPCYKTGEYKRTSCYDQEFGYFIEFKIKRTCVNETCYYLKNTMGGDITEKQMNLNAANIENLKKVIMAEIQLNKEISHNFGLVENEIIRWRTILIKTISSIAKIDDNLLGTLLDNQARSQFINEDEFYLTPCEGFKSSNSNCKRDMVFRTGRWELKTNETNCYNTTKTRSINILEFLDLPIGKEQLTESAYESDGWTAVMKEQRELKDKIEVTKKEQIRFISDGILRPAIEAKNEAELRFIIIQLIGFAVMIVLMILLHLRVGRMASPTEASYLRSMVMEPEPTKIITNQPGELKRILLLKRGNAETAI